MDERRPHGSGPHRLFDDAEVARRFQRRLRTVAPAPDPRQALQYDESGYPIERTTLADRVRRLITG